MVDWSNLPPELLHLISRKLADVFDFVRFRAVCTRWLSAAPLSDPPPQLPWLLEHRRSEKPHLSFYSLSSGKTHTIQVPLVRCKQFTSPSFGYMLKCDRERSFLSLINPLTNKEIHLPPLDYSFVWLIYVDRDPTRSGEYVVVGGRLRNQHFFAFCKPGDNQWTTLQDKSYLSYAYVYYKGMYIMDDRKTMTTKVIDLSTLSVKYVIPTPPPVEIEFSSTLKNSFFVESSGEVLRLSWCIVRAFRHKDTGLTRHYKYYFDVYRLDFGKGDPCWVKTDNIGDQILFLDLRSATSVRASDFAGIRGNCIYFLEQTGKLDADYKPFYILCRYDIKERTEEVLPCPIEKGGFWFMPSLC